MSRPIRRHVDGKARARRRRIPLRALRPHGTHRTPLADAIMPVPVAVSGWKSDAGGGVDAAPTVMETAGPFAALAAQQKRAKTTEDDDASAAAECDVSIAPAVANAAAKPSSPLPSASPASTAPGAAPRWGVAVNDLDWSYPGIDGQPVAGQPPLIKNFNLKLAPGSCCLLLGANGAGKTTLLKILGGKHMVPKEKVLIHGREAFYDTGLTTSGQLSLHRRRLAARRRLRRVRRHPRGRFPRVEDAQLHPGRGRGAAEENHRGAGHRSDVADASSVGRPAASRPAGVRAHDSVLGAAPRRDHRGSGRPGARGSDGVPEAGVRGEERHDRVRDAHIRRVGAVRESRRVRRRRGVAIL